MTGKSTFESFWLDLCTFEEIWKVLHRVVLEPNRVALVPLSWCCFFRKIILVIILALSWIVRCLLSARNSDCFTVARADHSTADCLMVVVMSHGEPGHLHSRDTIYQTQELWLRFTGDKCPTLVGKPKLFFIQVKEPRWLVNRSRRQTRQDRTRQYTLCQSSVTTDTSQSVSREQDVWGRDYCYRCGEEWLCKQDTNRRKYWVQTLFGTGSAIVPQKM